LAVDFNGDFIACLGERPDVELADKMFVLNNEDFLADWVG